MSTYPYAIDFTGVLERLEPHLVTRAARDESGQSTANAEGTVGQLVEVARDIAETPHEGSLEPRLKEFVEEPSRTVTSSVAAFLLAQLHFEREMPALALRWSQKADKDFNGDLPTLARAAHGAQEVGIHIQGSRLDRAEKASAAVRRLRGISRHEYQLVAPPLQHLPVSKAYEDGRTLDEVRKLIAYQRPAYRHLWLARVLMNSGRHNAALEELDGATRLLRENPQSAVMLLKVRLHKAQAYYSLVRLTEAYDLFAELEPQFAERKLHNARLATHLGRAHIERIRHEYLESASRFRNVLKKGEDLGLWKSVYRANLGLAMVALDRGRFEETESYLAAAKTYLNSKINRKELCTLYTRSRDLAFRRGDARTARRYCKLAERLLEKAGAAEDEMTLFWAGAALAEYWYHLRQNDLHAAKAVIDEAEEHVRSTVFLNPVSDYREEGGAKYLAAKLLRARAYWYLRDENPEQTLLCTRDLPEYLRQAADADSRSRSRFLLLNGLAHALLGDAAASIACLDKIDPFATKIAGNPGPIRKDLYEYACQDNRDAVSALVFAVYRNLRHSPLAEQFRPYEADLASVIRPSRGLAFAKQTKPTWRSEKRLRAFLADYQRSLEDALQESEPDVAGSAVSTFLAARGQQIEAEIARGSCISDESADDFISNDGLYREGEEIWKLIAAARSMLNVK